MNALRIDHTAIVVQDLEEATSRYASLYGVKHVERHFVPDQQVEIAFLPLAGTQLELVRPLNPDTGVGRFLAKNGERLHHIGVLVADIRSELKALQEQGVELLDTSPRQGVHGMIAFLHPRTTNGVLTELVQRWDDAEGA